MSRIADVLRKAREENAISGRHVEPAGPAPRSISDVKVPWLLRGEPTVEMELALPEPLPRHEPAAEHPLASPTPVPAYQPAARVPTRPPTVSTARSTVDPPAAEAANQTIASLVHALFLAGDTPSTRHVLFTSVDDSPSAADVVIQIAVALAEQSSESVYLVDMDLNFPSLHLRFELAGKDGFSDALRKDGELRDYSYKAESAGDLWVMPAGLPMGPPSLARALPAAARRGLGDETTQRRIATLIDTPDYVIAYGAAIGSYSDAELVGRLFDGVVLVVQPGATTAEATRRAANAVKASKSQLLGTVLDNGVSLI